MERQLYKNENKTNVKRKQTNIANASNISAMSSASQRQSPGALSLFANRENALTPWLPHFLTENRGALFLEML